MKPYVVSADIQILLEGWAARAGFIAPASRLFKEIRKDSHAYLSKIFSNVDLVPEEELKDGIESLVGDCNLPTISLDKVYHQSQLTLEITRCVDSNKKNRGLGRRAGTSSLKKQFHTLTQHGIKEAILVDDVIFSGDLIARVKAVLQKSGILIPFVICGIGIGDGVKRIENTDCEGKCVRYDREVIDEICERDFYPGVPLSGRMLLNNGNVGLPYILPFGDPQDWASIPAEWQKQFSRFYIEQTIELFEAVELASGKTVSCADLERKVFMFPQDKRSYVHALRQLL